VATTARTRRTSSPDAAARRHSPTTTAKVPVTGIAAAGQQFWITIGPSIMAPGPVNVNLGGVNRCEP
jgi:hypothetical protein